MEIKQKRIFVIIFLCLVLMVSGLSTVSYLIKQRGTVNLNLQVADTKQLSVRFNDKSYPVNKLPASYNLYRGSYTITIIKSGYKNFSTNFKLLTGQIITINAKLLPEYNTPQLSLSNIKDSRITTTSLTPLTLANTLPATTTITKMQYFYDQTWAVASVDQHTGIGKVSFVAQYSFPEHNWILVIPPDDVYTKESVQNLPIDVKNYLYAHFTVNADYTNVNRNG